MKSRHILVVDDEDFVRESLVEVLKAEGYSVAEANGGEAALAELRRRLPDVIVTDLKMDSGDGHFLLKKLADEGMKCPVIMVTGAGDVQDAVRAMKSGAFDFVLKPVEPDQLLRLIGHAFERVDLQRNLAVSRQNVSALRAGRLLVGESKALHEIREQIAQVAASQATVLVTGESGTGKELVAEAIHLAGSQAAGNLVRVNCAAIPEGLFESEFFGHRKGSFSGALAHRVGRFEEAESGTLQLDEIGTLSAEAQAKLLRVLEGGEYQVVGESQTRIANSRIVAVTNEDLRECVKNGSFRADLYYRLNIFPIHVTPLRDRRDDIPAISAALIARILSQGEPDDYQLDPRALQVLMEYHWPGNVRELRNLLERALIVSGRKLPDASLLGRLIESSMDTNSVSNAVASLHLRSNLDQLEKNLVAEAIEQAGGKKKRAAEFLGIDARNLSYYLKKHGLDSGA